MDVDMDSNGNGGFDTGGGFDISNSPDTASVSVDAAAPSGFDGMQFSGADAETMGGLALGMGVAAATMGAGSATAAALSMAMLSQSAFATALANLVHDMELGLGMAVTANPSISMFGSINDGVAVASGATVTDQNDQNGTYGVVTLDGNVAIYNNYNQGYIPHEGTG